jgi:hypothetical protein
MDKRILVTALVSAIGGGIAGGAITYLTVKKTFAERAQRDIDDVKAAYAERYEKQAPLYSNMPGEADEVVTTPVGTIKRVDLIEAQEFVRKLGYQTVPVDENTQESSVNVYAITPDENLGEEVENPLLIGYDREKLRAAHKPYLISHEEFHNTETEWDKSSIIYYEGDDVLTDEGDRPVDNIEYLVGEKHLEFFGIRSGGDKNQVFVRNPQISTDFEITRNSGDYTVMVLGIPKGSEKVGTRRMRPGDDD